MFTALQSTSRQALLIWTQVLVFASVLLTTLSPFSAPAMVVGAFVVQAFWIQRDHGDLISALRSTAVTRGWIVVAAFVGYVALRLLPELQTEALPGVAAMAVMGLLTFGTSALLPRQNDDVQAAIAQAFLIAFGVAAAVHVFEGLTGFALRRALWTAAPIFRPRLGKIDVDGDTVRVLVPYIANQTSAVLAALLWPVLMLDLLAPRGRWQRGTVWISVALAVTAIFMSDQATSKMAVLAAGATWAIVAVLPRTVRPLLMAAWVAATLLVLPVAMLMYEGQAFTLPMAYSAQHRVVIWGVTAEKTLQHPLLGIGTGRTPEFDETMRASVKTIPGTRLPIATNRHAHNVFLQAWYETGALGIGLMMLAGLAVVGWIGRAPARAQPMLAAAFVGSVVAASFSYSLLAAWFLATFALTALFCRFAIVVADGNARHTPQHPSVTA